MKFVFYGLLGFLVVGLAGYLYYVPATEVAENVRLGFSVATENVGAALKMNRPQMTKTKGAEEQTEDAYAVDESRIPYPRPRRLGRRTLSSSSPSKPTVIMSTPPADVVLLEPQPSLQLTTIERGSVKRIEVYRQLTGERKLVRLEDGRVIEEAAVN